MSNDGVKKVPPDGGYGWVVVCVYALNNVVVLPLIGSFGLVLQEAFKDTHLTQGEGTLVLTLNHGVGMLVSLFGGPLLRRFSYRKVAVVGSLLIVGGLAGTAFADRFWTFLLCYSVINSLGIAAVMAAFTVAINSFFKVKRSRAVGLAMSITGLGTICMPILMSTLLQKYGWSITVQILSSLCLVSFVAACLLRPVKRYMVDPEQTAPLTEPEAEIKTNGVSPQPEPLSATNCTKSLSLKALNDTSTELRPNLSHPDLRGAPDPPRTLYKWWESQEINLASSLDIFSEESLRKEEPPAKSPPRGFFKRIVVFFDLYLLTDPVFLNILLGMSVASCVETNFTLLFPLILENLMQFDTSTRGTIMAVVGGSDTVFRLFTPFVGEWLKKPPRFMYAAALLVMIGVRTILLYVNTFTGMVVLAIAIGVTKGMRTVYMNVIIPNYVPIERLPYASGIQMFCNGIIIISMGSVLGSLRENTGSYHIPIIVLNTVTLIAVVAWSAEFIYFKSKNKPMRETTTA